MGNEDYVELQQLRLVIDDLQGRIVKLEKINVDLESRLEDQAKQSMAVEKECLQIEQKWRSSNGELEKVSSVLVVY
jgi:prefoldin subunit 5